MSRMLLILKCCPRMEPSRQNWRRAEYAQTRFLLLKRRFSIKSPLRCQIQISFSSNRLAIFRKMSPTSDLYRPNDSRIQLPYERKFSVGLRIKGRMVVGKRVGKFLQRLLMFSEEDDRGVSRVVLVR